jgi:hypothetical protein
MLSRSQSLSLYVLSVLYLFFFVFTVFYVWVYVPLVLVGVFFLLLYYCNVAVFCSCARLYCKYFMLLLCFLCSLLIMMWDVCVRGVFLACVLSFMRLLSLFCIVFLLCVIFCYECVLCSGLVLLYLPPRVCWLCSGLVRVCVLSLYDCVKSVFICSSRLSVLLSPSCRCILLFCSRPICCLPSMFQSPSHHRAKSLSMY